MKRRQFIWCLALLVAPSLLAGCSALKSDTGPPQAKDGPTWGGLFHRPAKTRDSLFFNEKSWDIEQRLERQLPSPSL